MAIASGFSVSPRTVDINAINSTKVRLTLPADRYDPIDWYGYVLSVTVDNSAGASHAEDAVIFMGTPPGRGGSGYGSLVNLYPSFSTTLGNSAVNMFPLAPGKYIHFWAQGWKRTNGLWSKDGGKVISNDSIRITGTVGKSGTASISGGQGTNRVPPSGEKRVTLRWSGFDFGSYRVTQWYLYAGSWCVVDSWNATSQSGSGTRTVDFPSSSYVTKGGHTNSIQCELKAYLDNGSNVSHKWTVNYGYAYVPPPPTLSTPKPTLSPTTSDISKQGDVDITVSWPKISGASSYSVQIIGKGKTVTKSVSTTSYTFNLKQTLSSPTFAEGDSIYAQVRASGSGYTSSGYGKTSNSHTITRDRGSGPTSGYLIGRRNIRNQIAWKGDKVTLYYSGQRDGSYPIKRFELVRLDDESVKKTWTPADATKGTSDWAVDVSGITLPAPNKSAVFELRAYDVNNEAVYMNGGDKFLQITVESYPGLVWVWGDDKRWHEAKIFVCTNTDPVTWNEVPSLWLRVPESNRSANGKWVQV